MNLFTEKVQLKILISFLKVFILQIKGHRRPIAPKEKPHLKCLKMFKKLLHRILIISTELTIRNVQRMVITVVITVKQFL